MDYEFDIGQRVTFCSYGIDITMVVADRTNFNLFCQRDDRKYYHLKMDKPYASICTVTTGKYIKESKIFVSKRHKGGSS